jgi:hypothetical protein
MGKEEKTFMIRRQHNVLGRARLGGERGARPWDSNAVMDTYEVVRYEDLQQSMSVISPGVVETGKRGTRRAWRRLYLARARAGYRHPQIHLTVCTEREFRVDHQPLDSSLGEPGAGPVPTRPQSEASEKGRGSVDDTDDTDDTSVTTSVTTSNGNIESTSDHVDTSLGMLTKLASAPCLQPSDVKR